VDVCFCAAWGVGASKVSFCCCERALLAIESPIIRMMSDCFVMNVFMAFMLQNVKQCFVVLFGKSHEVILSYKLFQHCFVGNVLLSD
jgi:hypothetical protein